MNTIIKITLIIFLSITNINNFVFANNDITRIKGKGLGSDYYPIYVDNQPRFIKSETSHNCFQMSAVNLDLPGCQEYIVYTPPSCGNDFYSCDDGEVLGELKEKDEIAIWTCQNKKGEKEICDKIKKTNTEGLVDLCGNDLYSCAHGSKLEHKETFNKSWVCKKTYDEMKSKKFNCQHFSNY